MEPKDHAIFMLGPDGIVVSWNRGAEVTKGKFSAWKLRPPSSTRLYLPEDFERGEPERLLKAAAEHGLTEAEGWRVRKDGSRFWAEVAVSALRDDSGRLRGFSKVTRDISVRKQAEEALRKARSALPQLSAPRWMPLSPWTRTSESSCSMRQRRRFSVSRSRRYWSISGPLHPGALPRSSPQPCAKFWIHRGTGRTSILPESSTASEPTERIPARGLHSQATISGEKLFTVILRE